MKGYKEGFNTEGTEGLEDMANAGGANPPLRGRGSYLRAVGTF